MVRHHLLGRFPHSLLLVCQQTALEQLAWGKENSRNDKCDQVSICEQNSKNRCYRFHIAPSSPLHLAVQHPAVVCLASAPYKEPLNDGACAGTARHELSDVLKSGSATPSSHLATKRVRVNVLHEHVCALNSQVLDWEWGSSQSREHKITKTNCSHRENECV